MRAEDAGCRLLTRDTRCRGAQPPGTTIYNPLLQANMRGTDISHIRTHEGWLYLAVVLLLFSLRVIGWSMQSRITREIVLDALLLAVCRRKPAIHATVHSDEGSRYTCHDWQSFLKAHGLECSTSRCRTAMTIQWQGRSSSA